MRGLLTTALAVAAMTAASGDAYAYNLSPSMSLVLLYSTSDASSSTVAPRDVAPGQMVMITGECVAESGDVQVVLSLADMAQGSAGFHAMLVTEQTREDGSLRVRVPNMPEARNHVFRVRLFVGSDNPCICEAGSIRIG